MIPDSRRRLCEFCQKELDIDGDGVHQFTKGWVKNRSGGGGHGVSLPQRENRFAHGYCVDRKTDGTFNQGALL